MLWAPLTWLSLPRRGLEMEILVQVVSQGHVLREKGSGRGLGKEAQQGCGLSWRGACPPWELRSINSATELVLPVGWDPATLVPYQPAIGCELNLGGEGEPFSGEG